jgi:hypothetical protein
MTAALALAIEVMAALILLAVSLGTLSGQSRRERDTHREWMERNAWEASRTAGRRWGLCR